MRLTALRVVLLAAVLAAGWIGGSAMGENQQGIIVCSAGSIVLACGLVGYFVIVDYREREKKREQEAEERLLHEVEKLKDEKR